MRLSSQKLSIVLLAITSLAMHISCLSKDPVTGRSTLNFMSESQEIALGEANHDTVIQQFGLYDDSKWQNYVSGIGDDIASVSHRSHLDFHFSVVDSPVINAFALPGGWVYFTRGILAHFNSEDELAGVMGHEVGHVTARHGAEQYSRTMLAGIGLELGSAFSEDFRQYRGLIEAGTGLLFLRFSRGQESESDELGVAYSTALGYNSHEMAGFFRTISRLSANSSQQVPNFLSTHPNPVRREERVHELTEQAQAAGNFKPRNTSRNNYLRRLEGMVYGEDPRQGYVDEDTNIFYHPQRNVQLPIPRSWQYAKNATAVQMVDPNEKGALILQYKRDHKSQTEEAAAFLEATQAVETARNTVRLNGYSALRIHSTITQRNQDGSVAQELRVISYFMSGDNQFFIAHGFAASNDFPGLEGTFRQSIAGFGRITNRAARNVKPERLRIRQAPRSASLQDNLRAMDQDDQRLAELALLNGMELSDTVDKGTLLKTIGR